MKVGLSTTYLEPCHNRNRIDGIGVYTGQLQENFEKLGHEVVGYAFPPKSSDVYLQRSQPFPGSFGMLASLGIVSRGLIKHAIPVDLMHFTDYRIVPSKCPVVATLHDAIPFKFPEMCNPRFRGLKNIVQRSVAQFADHVITLSQASVPDVIRYYGVPVERISVVGCGVSKTWLIDPEVAEIEKVLQKYGIRRGYFLFVGTLQPRKNIDRIIAAYNKLPANIQKERKLVFVGRSGWRCDETIACLQRLISDGNAVWLDSVEDNRELRCIYAGASIFVFPSLYEGYGIPVLEAFACEVPVITSNVSSLPEVSQGIGVEVDPTSVDEIAGAMEWLVKDETECRQRAFRGKMLAKSLTWDSVAAQTLAVYQKML